MHALFSRTYPTHEAKIRPYLPDFKKNITSSYFSLNTLDQMMGFALGLISIACRRDDPAYLVSWGRGSGLQLSPTKDLKSVNWGSEVI